jgi:pimeloyl-ACP methyl ester carboxylesterase
VTGTGTGTGTGFEPPAARRGTVAVSRDGTRLHVEEHGPEGAPTVVLIHGWTCGIRFWAPVVHRLAADHRVIAYDQRGHGRSGVPAAEGYSTAALADDLSAVLEETLAPGERAVLVGHSMGGMTIMAAAHRPEVRARTAAVLLASTGSGSLVTRSTLLPPRVRNRRVRDAFHRLMLTSPAPLGPPSALTRAALKYGVLSRTATRDMVEATARVVHACGSRPRAAWGRVLAALEEGPGLEAIEAPTAILVGTGDKLTPPVHAREMAARLRNPAGLTELPGLGHMTPTEDPDAVTRVIRDLVAAHLAAPGGHPSGEPPTPTPTEANATTGTAADAADGTPAALGTAARTSPTGAPTGDEGDRA